MKQQFFVGDVVKLNQLGLEAGERAMQGANHELWNSKYLLMLKQQATSVVSRPPSLLDDKVWLEDNAFFVSPEHLDVVHLAISPTKVWCDTCEGTGEVDETLGGESFSGRDTPCPDCDGKGWWERVVAASAEVAPVQQDKKHSHYFKKCGYDYVDVYRILKMFDVTDPCISHACKKLLVSGGRGFKDIDHDIQDVIDTLVRWQEMRKEDDELCK